MCIKLGIGSEGVWIAYKLGRVTASKNFHDMANTETWGGMGCV